METPRQNHTIDASGKKVGRVASAAAKLLMGKQTVTYAPNKVPNIFVEIINAGKADISAGKMKQELHASFSGYPSGIKVPTVAYIIEKKGASELFRRAIKGMLPKNKLQTPMMKHLTVKE
jgi:large subunit ribosomal protein L13